VAAQIFDLLCRRFPTGNILEMVKARQEFIPATG